MANTTTLSICIDDDGYHTFTTSDLNFVQIIESCGWKVHAFNSPSTVFECPALRMNPTQGVLYDIDVVKSTMFLKKVVLIADRVCSMLEQHCLPLKSSWLSRMLFCGDLKSTQDFIIQCCFVDINDILVGDKDTLDRRSNEVVFDIVQCLKRKDHPRLTSNAYIRKAFEVEQNMSLFDLRSTLMDALSLSCDLNRPLTSFPPIRNDECIANVETFSNLVFDEKGNINEIFSKLDHSSYVFLPVRDLQKSKSGRLGVHSMSSFLEDPSSQIVKDVLQAEDKLRGTVFDILKSKFPPIIRQFVIQNESLVLLRLSNTLLVSQNLHVDNLHGFPHSQFGCFMALNCNQYCHVHLDTTKDDYELVAPFMEKSTLHPFKSATYYHSGVSCSCEGESKIAATWYQDCVVQHSTGSLRKYSSNTNSFTNAFDALCMSKIPSVENCGGCRLELLVSVAQCKKISSESTWCDFCKVLRCEFCKSYEVRPLPDSSTLKVDINSELEISQQYSIDSNARFKPICTHGPRTLRNVQPHEFVHIFITKRQQQQYSQNARQIFRFMNFFCLNVPKYKFPDIMQTLGVKCARSFILSTVYFCTYFDTKALSLSEIVINFKPSNVNLNELYFNLRLNENDPEYFAQHCNRFMKILTVLLDEGAHLRCTAKNTAESATCVCGVKASWKPVKSTMKPYTDAMTLAEDNLTMVI